MTKQRNGRKTEGWAKNFKNIKTVGKTEWQKKILSTVCSQFGVGVGGGDGGGGGFGDKSNFKDCLQQSKTVLLLQCCQSCNIYIMATTCFISLSMTSHFVGCQMCNWLEYPNQLISKIIQQDRMYWHFKAKYFMQLTYYLWLHISLLNC
jgi:hypothetical protein